MEYQHKYGTIQYSREGHGNPVLFIHGFGENGDIFNNIKAQLAKYYTVYIIHLPGLKGSSFTEEMKRWNLADFAKLIAQFIDDTIQAPVPVLGHSMGGYITLEIGSQFPEKVLGLGLIHSTASTDSEEKKEAREKNIEFIEKYGSEKFIRTTTPNLYSPEFQENDDSIIKQHIDDNIHTDPQVLIAYTRAMIRRNEHISLLKSTKLPVLWIVGKKDQAIKFEDTISLVYLSYLSFVNLLNQSAHMGMFEEPERVYNAIKEFLFYIYRKNDH